MEFNKLSERALAIRALFRKRETKQWDKKDLMLGMVGDVGDLAKLVMAQEGMRGIEDKEEKLKHELADCFWSLLVLAHEYGIDLEKEFFNTMNDLEKKLR